MSEYFKFNPDLEKELTYLGKKTVYHISISGKLPNVVRAKVPKTYLPDEDCDTPRVSVSKDLMGALEGSAYGSRSTIGDNSAAYLYRFEEVDCYRPSEELVPDVGMTGEMWLLPQEDGYTPILVAELSCQNYSLTGVLSRQVQTFGIDITATDVFPINNEVEASAGLSRLVVNFARNFNKKEHGTCRAVFISYGDAENVSLEDNETTEYLYILLVDTGTLFGNLTKKLTKVPYGHASLSLDSKLQRLYSYNMDKGGFSQEDIMEYEGRPYSLYRCPVTTEQMQKVEDYINELSLTPEETSYSFQGIVNALAKKDIFKSDNIKNAICSEFVVNVLGLINVQLFRHHRTAIQPYEIAKSRKVQFVRRGIMRPSKPNYL